MGHRHSPTYWYPARNTAQQCNNRFCIQGNGVGVTRIPAETLCRPSAGVGWGWTPAYGDLKWTYFTSFVWMMNTRLWWNKTDGPNEKPAIGIGSCGSLNPCALWTSLWNSVRFQCPPHLKEYSAVTREWWLFTRSMQNICSGSENIVDGNEITVFDLLTQSLTQPLAHSPAHSFKYLFTHSLNYLYYQSINQSINQSLIEECCENLKP
jgi:hypothetical protein